MGRLIHGTPFPPLAAPRVIGLDEWAWRRGRRFGTIVCDLEHHQVVDLLPERSAPSAAQWLQAHPSVESVCRDRSGLYAEGIRHGAPQAVQVVDWFHLVQNLRDALERLFLRYCRDLNTLGASLNRSSEPTLTPATISQARHKRWVHLYHQIQRLHAQQLGIAAIAAWPRTYHQVQVFRRMIRERRGHEFDAWVTEVQQTGVKELRGFVQGLLKDEAAVHAGLSLVWSNGPTEGFIHRLKLIKRQAYGRAGVDFLRHRILAPSAGAAA
jgi:transposase